MVKVDKYKETQRIISLGFGLGSFKRMLKEGLISEKEYENMTKDFEERINKRFK